MNKAGEAQVAPETPATPTTPETPAAPVYTARQPAPQVVHEHQFQGGIAIPAHPTTGATVETPVVQQGKVFTQAELDSIIAGRLQQERQKYADYDDLKVKAQAAEDAKKSESEKAAERLSALERQNQNLDSQWKRTALENAAIKEASKLNLDLKAAVDLAVVRMERQGNLTINADGTVEGLAEVVKAIAAESPGLILRPTLPTVAANNPARGNQPAGRTDEMRRQEYFGGGSSGVFGGGGVYWPNESEVTG